MKKKWGFNLHSTPLEISHGELERTGESPFRSLCPVCSTGILPISVRHPISEEFVFDRFERCTFCAQVFWYTDNEVEGVKFNSKQPKHLTDAIVAACAKAVEHIDLDSPDPE